MLHPHLLPRERLAERLRGARQESLFHPQPEGSLKLKLQRYDPVRLGNTPNQLQRIDPVTLPALVLLGSASLPEAPGMRGVGAAFP